MREIEAPLAPSPEIRHRALPPRLFGIMAATMLMTFAALVSGYRIFF